MPFIYSIFGKIFLKLQRIHHAATVCHNYVFKTLNHSMIGRRGKGHEGRTHKPKPAEFKEHTPDACPQCGSDNLSITKTEERDITKVVRTVRSITTRHTINTCRCSCGQKGIKPETGLPDKDSYDSSIIAEVADDYVCRMPFRMNPAPRRPTPNGAIL